MYALDHLTISMILLSSESCCTKFKGLLGQMLVELLEMRVITMKCALGNKVGV